MASIIFWEKIGRALNGQLLSFYCRPSSIVQRLYFFIEDLL